MGEAAPWHTEGGLATEPLLESLGIAYRRVSTADPVAKVVRDALTLAESSERPVALLLTQDLMWEES